MGTITEEDFHVSCSNLLCMLLMTISRTGGDGCHLRVVPLGNFIEGQAHPNVFAFPQFSSTRGFSIFCVVKFLYHVFFVFAFRWFLHRGCYVYFPIVFSSNSLYILYIFIFFLYIFSLYSGFFDLCWVISLGCRPLIDRPAHTLYIYRIV